MADMVASPNQLGYEQTLMYGRYTKELGSYAKKEAARLKREKERADEAVISNFGDKYCATCKYYFYLCKSVIFARFGEDWIFLLLLGFIMALLSFGLDYTIAKFQKAHVWFFYELEGNPFPQYLAWVSFPIVFIMFSTGFTHLVGPNAIGSGIPEMKTILRGVILKEYLTFRTLISKMVGLATSIGSSLPIGKEGPFVHIASMVANLLGKLIRSSKGAYETLIKRCNIPPNLANENYHLNKQVLDLDSKDVIFEVEYPCRFIYPTLVAFTISSITFPLGLGQFMAGELTQKEVLDELFSNTTWTTGQADVDDAQVISHWKHPDSNIYVTLVVFIVMKFWMTAVAVTLPVPAGVFMPVFIIGAAFGRLVGECMAAWFPDGVRSGDAVYRIIPGGYAVVGAAALSGSVTHTISTSVIVFELTGQIVHILPVMIAVLIANAIAHLLQPSIYDSIIQIKRLPYLPDITNFNSKKTYRIYVEDIMSNTTASSISSIRSILKKTRQLRSGSDSGVGSAEQQVDKGIYDMTPEEQASWENDRLQHQIIFDECQIDPAPFQLVEKTSLCKVHSLFSLLGLNHAYVTTLGRLVGVLSLKEVRRAIEGSRLYDSSESSDNASDDGESNHSNQSPTEHELQLMVDDKTS
ncbi:chloride channel protein 2-like [Saccoglossus kowalevskii]